MLDMLVGYSLFSQLFQLDRPVPLRPKVEAPLTIELRRFRNQEIAVNLTRHFPGVLCIVGVDTGLRPNSRSTRAWPSNARRMVG